MLIRAAESRRLLLVTATVRPQSVGRTTLMDTHAREEQYKGALSWWACALRGTGTELLVVENSGFRWADWLRHLELDTGIAVHVESYEERADLRKGKGVGEALMYERVAHRLETDLCHVTDIVKCTGRLKLRSRKGIPRAAHVPRHITSRLSRDLTRMDTRIYGMDRWTFVDYFADLARHVDEAAGIYLEHAACRASLRALAAGVRRREFNPLPLLLGVSGSTGRTYRGRRVLLSDLTRRLDSKVSADYI